MISLALHSVSLGLTGSVQNRHEQAMSARIPRRLALAVSTVYLCAISSSDEVAALDCHGKILPPILSFRFLVSCVRASASACFSAIHSPPSDTEAARFGR